MLIFFFNQFLPSTNLVTIIELDKSPTTFKHVAGGSINHPIVAIIGKASSGNPYKVTINISPINPPPGIPDITTALKTAINNAIK